MKPSFALSLSFEGIRLLHRAAGGWRVVGDVALDAEDLAAELATLRKTATALDPGGLRSKLLLPNEQIKYLTIDTPGLDEDGRKAAAEAALDGATPYPVSDLAFDISADGDQTHVAAVARETLAEAEGFATDHNFNPVSFVAAPGEHGYLGEPFFGTTTAAASILDDDEVVEPDGIAVVVVGNVEVPKGPVSAEVPDPQPEPNEPINAEPEQTELVERVPEPAEAAEPEPSAELESLPVPPVTEASSAAEATTRDDPPAPAVGFASRRAPERSKTPALGGVNRAGSAEPQNTEPVETPVASSTIAAAELQIEPDSTSLAPEPAPKPEAKGGFLSRRRSKPAETVAAPAIGDGGEIAPKDSSEKERMTIFGARKADVGGKPRFLGLILTAALLVFLAGVAAWASVFLDDGLNLSKLFGERAAPQVTQAPEIEPPKETPPEAEIVVAALDPSLTEEDAAVLDALREPALPEPEKELSQSELEAQYAATGIWPRAPQVPPDPPELIGLGDLYLTSIDTVSQTTDAVALPGEQSFLTDRVVAAIASPPAPGTEFSLDAQGLVVATVEGALSPDGYTVFLGKPPLIPPATPTRFQSTPEEIEAPSALAAVRPKPRPANLQENTERAQLGGLTRTELAGYRPALRPQSLQQQAEAAARAEPETPVDTQEAVAEALSAPDPLASATRFAVSASVRPDPRPRNFSNIVKRAKRSAPQDDVRVASVAAVAPRVVKPKIPSKASVARQATVKNAINLNRVNLIGVYGKPSSRRALVRLSNGRYKKVVVGDRIDGGRVSAIGDSELRYTKRGRDLVLKMPR